MRLFKQIETLLTRNDFKSKLPHIGVGNLAANKKQQDHNLIIDCKRKQYNHFHNTRYDKLDAVPLASKGWTHNLSKGDYFVVNPFPASRQEITIDLNQIGIDAQISKRLFEQNLEKFTEFQNEAICTVLSGKHCILAAETGCGKTLAYLIPIFQKLLRNKSEGVNMPRALILTPNRELAYQIGSVAEAIAEALDIKSKVVTGGHTKRIMLNPDFEPLDILIGTPGVIGKLSTVGIYKLSNVEIAVLDEADTLIDDSFSDRLTSIIKRLSNTQLVLVSATLPTTLPGILEAYADKFKKVTSPLLHTTLSHITQKFLRLGRSLKPQQILQIVKKTKEPLLIFTNRNATCHWLSHFFKNNNINCARVNGDMNFEDRIEQWNKFASKRTEILVCTDICSRGLDTTNIKHVVNYDFPLYSADYLHRIGRTGRFGTYGRVTNFVTGEEEIKLVQKIELAIRRNEPIPKVDGNITRIVQKKILRNLRQNNLM
ncbi:hypothetical protein FQA39_LY08496 [Lamprigera yunnana]|nr:hypothetical protein FQA39_LY08496 [Lamprigera yunnana]